MGKKKAFYVDIDGTLARFHDADKMFIEAMWTPGFYRELKPFENLVEAVRMFLVRNPNAEVFVLSAVLDTDPPFIEGEKNAWLDEFVPEIDRGHRIFTKAGEDKSKYLNMYGRDCFLLDDFNKNLYEFEAAKGHPIKFHNDVNHRGRGEFGGSKGNLWPGDIVHYYDSPEKICRDLEDIIFGKTYNFNEHCRELPEEPVEEIVVGNGNVTYESPATWVIDDLIAEATAKANRNEGIGCDFGMERLR